jgi:hypothetical protein
MKKTILIAIVLLFKIAKPRQERLDDDAIIPEANNIVFNYQISKYITTQ